MEATGALRSSASNAVDVESASSSWPCRFGGGKFSSSRNQRSFHAPRTTSTLPGLALRRERLEPRHLVLRGGAEPHVEPGQLPRQRDFLGHAGLPGILRNFDVDRRAVLLRGREDHVLDPASATAGRRHGPPRSTASPGWLPSASRRSSPGPCRAGASWPPDPSRAPCAARRAPDSACGRRPCSAGSNPHSRA